MAIIFDPINKLIKITSGTSISALEIYNATMDWCDETENMGYTVPIRADGKFWMKEGVYSDSIFRLINGWKIKLYDGTYQFIITGTLLPEEGESRTVPPDNGNIEIIFEVSSQGTIVTYGSGVTQQDKEDIADLVEIQTGAPIKTIASVIENHHVGRVKLEGCYMLIYNKEEELVAKYELVKDSNERIIERIPQEVS